MTIFEFQKHPKGTPLNKINDNMYSKDAQWMTISNINNPQASSANAPASQNISNLIETFTTNIDDKDSKDTADMFRVNGQVGTFIAQKLLKGEKIRIGNNGDPIPNHSCEDITLEKRK